MIGKWLITKTKEQWCSGQIISFEDNYIRWKIYKSEIPWVDSKVNGINYTHSITNEKLVEVFETKEELDKWIYLLGYL
jgi:hypothetical protein